LLIFHFIFIYINVISKFIFFNKFLFNFSFFISKLLFFCYQPLGFFFSPFYFFERERQTDAIVGHNWYFGLEYYLICKNRIEFEKLGLTESSYFFYLKVYQNLTSTFDILQLIFIGFREYCINGIDCFITLRWMKNNRQVRRRLIFSRVEKKFYWKNYGFKYYLKYALANFSNEIFQLKEYLAYEDFYLLDFFLNDFFLEKVGNYINSVIHFAEVNFSFFNAEFLGSDLEDSGNFMFCIDSFFKLVYGESYIVIIFFLLML
jgi:hypothetical protein